MGKARSPLDVIKALPKRQGGAVPWVQTISAQQRKDYLEIIEYLRSLPPQERPSQLLLLKTIREAIGTAPCPNVLRDALRGE